MAQIIVEMPPGIEQYNADVTQFVHEMLMKLHYHRHKGHWKDIDIFKALNLLHGEVNELEEAIRNNDYAEVHKEAADVANYALILSSVLRRKNQQLDLFDG
jgi:NTP pyrophosphatase (non-canonical NTP hydrolase)